MPRHNIRLVLETAEDRLDMVVTALKGVLGDSDVVEMAQDALADLKEARIEAEILLRALDGAEHREGGQYEYCPACGCNVTDAECDCFV